MKNKLIFLLILFLAFSLRLIWLAQIPPELNRDEASVGYNAYSILKTGRDEHGRVWPLVFRAFGDNKIPGYIYLTAVTIRIFGLNPFAVRLPAAFFGFLTIAAAYFFVREIWPEKEKRALLFSLLLTVSPFHLHYSRQQFETTVALFFTLTGIVFLLKAREKIKYLYLALPFFILSFFIYNTPLFILPVLLFFIFWLYKDKYLIDPGKKRAGGLFICLFFVGLLGYWLLAREGNLGRANTTIFNQESMAHRIEENVFLLNQKNWPRLTGKIFFNQLVLLIRDFFSHYLAAFNPKFIFFSGDSNPWHSLGYLGFGNLPAILAPFILLGFLKLTINYKKKENIFVLGYLFISPLANGLTIDSPILTRLMNFHLLLILLAVLGLEEFWHWRQEKTKYKNIILIGLLFFSFINYLLVYFFIFPQKQDLFWLEGIKEVSQIVKEEEKEYDLVIFDRNVEVSYIFLAFYLPFEPADFQLNSRREFSGFDKVKSYGKFLFSENTAEWRHPHDLAGKTEKDKKILLIEKVTFGSRPMKEDNNRLINNYLGEPLWILTKVTS